MRGTRGGYVIKVGYETCHVFNFIRVYLEALGFLLRGRVLAQVEWVVQVEWNRVREGAVRPGKRWEGTGLAAC